MFRKGTSSQFCFMINLTGVESYNEYLRIFTESPYFTSEEKHLFAGGKGKGFVWRDASERVGCSGYWPQLRPASGSLNYVEEELKKLAKEIAKVETSRLIGEIDQETARLMTDSLINAAKTVKAAGEGIVKVRAEQAINAALAVLVKAIKAVA